MDWVSRMNEALDEMERQLTGEADLLALSRLLRVSPFQFQHIFSLMAGVPVGEYMRRRRMSRAAAELQGGAKVLDVALKYGYESPTAFNRAFRQVHGIAPSMARKPGAVVKNHPPIRFQITIKGAVEMNYRIETLESFTVLGKARTFSMEDCFDKIPKYWNEYYAPGQNPPVAGCLGICIDPCNGKDFTYIIGDNCEPDAPVPEGYQKSTIPAFTWAMFEDRGKMPGALQQLNRRIYTEWAPGNAEYELAGGYNIEMYTMGDMSSDDYRFELWVPVRAKQA